MNSCYKKYKEDLSLPESRKKLDDFCRAFQVKTLGKSKDTFKELPKFIQCMLLSYAVKILKNRDLFLEKNKVAYSNAFFLFKLFKGDLKKEEVFKDYLGDSELETLLKEAGEWAEGPKKEKKVFEDKSQKKEKPEENDPAYIFYYSLYEEKPESKMARRWLIEHGIKLKK